ncbi:tetratricopeptide repeat protein [Klebsiella pneumoniae subsp. pneumoniae]|nr:tetratricopeptide repeat protein [Klebsiella pneumoniae subsp. pneumoniae]
MNSKRVCKATGCCARPTSCATAATKRRRSPSSNGSPPRCAMISTLADWAQQRGDSQTAIADYQRVLRQEADNGDARLGLAEVYLAEGDKPAARRRSCS